MIEEFKHSVAQKLGIDPTVLYGHDHSLAKVLAGSPTAINSLDLVEAFAATIVALKLEGLVAIPAVTLDYSIDDVMDLVKKQLARVSQVQQCVS